MKSMVDFVLPIFYMWIAIYSLRHQHYNVALYMSTMPVCGRLHSYFCIHYIRSALRNTKHMFYSVSHVYQLSLCFLFVCNRFMCQFCLTHSAWMSFQVRLTLLSLYFPTFFKPWIFNIWFSHLFFLPLSLSFLRFVHNPLLWAVSKRLRPKNNLYNLASPADI